MIPIGITGHQVIPPGATTFIEQRIADIVQQYKTPVLGVSSLAAGADQLFSRVVLRLGGQIHAVIPCAKYETAFAHAAGRDSFVELLAKALRVETLAYREPSEEAFWNAGRRVVDLSRVLIAVWDGKASKGKGGTADVVAYARDQRVTTQVVWPAGLSR